MRTDYSAWPRKKLIRHIEAYGSGLHELANTTMKQQHELRKLRPLIARVEAIDQFREFLHGGLI